MSLTIRHLNADSTFLLTFQPVRDSPPSPGLVPGSFSILFDPWLFGASELFHRTFNVSEHTIPSCIPSLTALPEPDLVCISQGKPDHCHRETLCQLPADHTKTLILADPHAAKIIRSWRYFHPDKVQVLDKYDERKARRETLRRFTIPPISTAGLPGEVTIAHIPSRRDLAGLHSAIGITYRAPTSAPPFAPAPSAMPLTPPDTPPTSDSTCLRPFVRSHDRAISVLYAPHGVSYPHVQAYASSHLVSEAALPLTALLHSFDRVQNPWWLGGNVSSGVPGGLEIARNLLARCWISAHDEEKVIGGVTAYPIRTRKYRPEEVQRMIQQDMGRLGTE
ncbi:MAG: hypothetical protein M1838_005483, partial [Thelocarpon superellum]